MRTAQAPWLSRDWSRLRALLVLAFPLGIVMLLVSLSSNIPRYAIERHLGTTQLGIYAALAYLIVAGTTVISALGQSAVPRMAIYYATGDFRAFWSLSRRLMLIGAALGGAGFMLAHLIGAELMRIIYTSEYAEYVNVLEVLSLGPYYLKLP